MLEPFSFSTIRFGQRLMEWSRSIESAYFSKTEIFPVMHVVAIRKDILKQNSWLAEAVFSAYSQAKQLVYDNLLKNTWSHISLPWGGQEFEEARGLMGKNFWPYGIKPNRKTLAILFRYSYEQGLSNRELKIEELFDPSDFHLSETLG